MVGLKAIRKAKHLNQQKVALDLNISREALSYYENGKREPSLELLVKMSDYFNVSIDYLITGEDFQKKQTKSKKASRNSGRFFYFVRVNYSSTFSNWSAPTPQTGHS